MSLLVVGCVSISWEGRPKQAALPTVKGPEATDLVARIGKGRLVMNTPRGGIVALSLPGLAESTVRRAAEGQSAVHAVSGPDEKDRIAYYPTEGSSQKWTELGSPLAPRWAMWSLKVAEVQTGRFQTIVPHVDPRMRIDWGDLR